MEAYKNRVHVEKVALDQKILGLTVFTESDDFNTLDMHERDLLRHQLSVMEVYTDILLARINLWEEKDGDEEDPR